MVTGAAARYNGDMKKCSWMTCGLVLTLLFASGAEAAPTGKASIRSVGGVNEYTYTGPKKKKKVATESAAPALTLADGQTPAPAAPAATTNSYGPPPAAAPAASGRPVYSQTHVPGNPAAQPGSYTQGYNPGPNTQKANNGTAIPPGGAQILSTAPIYYPFPNAGGGGWGAGPIQLGPGGYSYNGGYNNGFNGGFNNGFNGGYYNNGYNRNGGRFNNGGCNNGCDSKGGGCDPAGGNGYSNNGSWSSTDTSQSYQGSYTGPWQPPAYNPPTWTPPTWTPPGGQNP